MNVYIDGIGYSGETNTQIGMQVIKSAALMLAKWPVKFNTNAIEAAAFLAHYFSAVITQHGPQSLDSIYRVFDALNKYEKEYMPKLTDDWPSKAQIRTQFEAFREGGNVGLLRAIKENQT